MLAAGMHEPEEFDFKEMLPHRNDNDGKHRLRAACCAFANSNGGFLVFGVADDKRLPPPERLVGINSVDDFPRDFGNFPRGCVPSVDWDFLKPALALPTAPGRVIHVMFIPRSWKAPHATGDADSGWRFYKRTNKGDEGMSMEEVRASFLGFYEKRLRLQLLDAELLALQESAKGGFIAGEDKIESSYSLVTFETQTIQSVVADTFVVTAGHTDLLATLQQLRQAVVVANNKAHIYFSTAGMSFTNEGQTRRAHNEFMAKKCGEIIELANRSRELLAPLLVP
jgi:Putative DNA-binding domain